jgi:hypothetical protein
MVNTKNTNGNSNSRLELQPGSNSKFLVKYTAFHNCLIIAVLLFSFQLKAQFVAMYTYSQTSGSYTALSGGTVVHAVGYNDPAPVSIPIPFTFNYDNVGYTSCSVNGNGYITFGATASAAAGYTPTSATTAYAGSISAVGLNLLSNGAAGSDIKYNTTGASPNRVFVVQWTNTRRNANNVAGADWNFQIQLLETSNIVRIVYGACAATNATNTVVAEVGLRGPSNGDHNGRWYNSPTSWLTSLSTWGWSNNFTMLSRNTALPASGTTFIWTPPTYPTNACNPAGNVIIFTNYDGGTLNISVDVNIPNLKVGICSYEAVQVNFTGAFVGNITAVRYAGYMGTNNHCGTGTAMTFTGVAPAIVTQVFYPAATMNDPSGNANIVCAYSCGPGTGGGCNSISQVGHYFMSIFGGSLRYEMGQYGCWTGTYFVSGGGNCCLIGQVLPIELNSFYSSCDDNSNAEIHWETSSETNNHYFTVERSTDGGIFTSIGTVNGNGTTSQPHSYSFIDPDTPNEPCYYRLKQTDYNGQSETFLVHAFDRTSCTDPQGHLRGYPNPAKHDFVTQFYTENETVITLRWLDISGRIVLEEQKMTQEGWNTFITDISEFPVGAYTLQIIGNIKLKEDHLLLIKNNE